MTYSERSPPKPSRYRRWLFSFLAGILALAALEGFSTLLLLAYDLVFWSQSVVAERHHSTYDEEIGWVAIPSLNLPDLFGPGIGLQTNAQGFRQATDTPTSVPPGRVRVVCTGDSFTFGYGVSNQNTWTAVLESKTPDLEVINLGMSGYGFDQAYLWYQRKGLLLEHQVHVFAFISDDFERMRKTEVFGYDKSRMKVEGGQLVLENVPVPEFALRFPWWVRNEHHFRRVSLVRLASRGLRSLQGRDRNLPVQGYGVMAATVEKILSDLVEEHRAQGRTFVLMYLPVRRELRTDVVPPDLEFLRDLAERHNIPFVDVVAKARELDVEKRRELFGRAGNERDTAIAEHFSVEGNRFTAEVLGSYLEVLFAEEASRIEELAGSPAQKR